MATTPTPAASPVNPANPGTTVQAGNSTQRATQKTDKPRRGDEEELVQGFNADQAMPPENVVEVTGEGGALGSDGASIAAAAAAAAIAAGLAGSGGSAAPGQRNGRYRHAAKHQ